MMLKLQYLMFLGFFMEAASECSGIWFRNDAYYDIHVLREGVTELRGLAGLLKRGFYQRNSRVYFTYTYYDKEVQSKTGYLNLNETKFNVVNLNNTNTNFGDDKSEIIYVGAKDGIYRLYFNDTYEKTNITNDNIIDIYVKNNDIYYVNANNELFINKNGVSTKVSGFDKVKIKKLVINKEGKMIFINTNDEVGVASLNVDGPLYSGAFGLRAKKARALSVDRYDIAYISSSDGLFEYKPSRDDFVKVSNLPNLQGILFSINNDAIVYAVNGILVYLTKNEIPCFGD